MNVAKRYSLELDIAGEAGYLEETLAWAARFGCEATLLEENGPGGGNPLFEFRGAKDDLRRLYADYASQAYHGWSPSDLAAAVEEDLAEQFDPQEVEPA